MAERADRSASLAGGGLRLWLERTLGLLAVLLLLALVAITCVDVVGRYWLNAPLQGAFELTQLGLAALIFAALPLTTERGGHIEADLLGFALGAAVHRLLGLLGGLLASLCLALFAWRLFDQGVGQLRDGSLTEALGVPYAPLAFFMAALSGLSAVIALIRAVAPAPSEPSHD